MGLATAKLVLAPEPERTGLYDVRLRFTKDRLSRYLTLPVVCQLKHWNKDERQTSVRGNYLLTGHNTHATDNPFLVAELARARQIIQDNPEANAGELKVLFRPKPESATPTDELDFLQYFERNCVLHETRGNPRTGKKRRSILRKLQAYVGAGNRLPFAALNVSWVKSYQAYFGPPAHSEHTANKELQVIHTVLKQAIADGLMEYHRDPFHHIRLKHPQRKKARLTMAEVAIFEALVPEPGIYTNHAHRNNWEAIAQHVWLAQFYSLGTRVGDVIEWRERDVFPGYVKFIERKTAKEKFVRRNPGLNKVLEHYPPTGNPEAYVFRLLDHTAKYAQASDPDPVIAQQQEAALLSRIESVTQQINKALARLAKRAGFTIPLTTHVARHSFADKARLTLGGDIYALRDMLNHSSVRTTEIYTASISNDEMGEKGDNVYGFSPSKTEPGQQPTKAAESADEQDTETRTAA